MLQQKIGSQVVRYPTDEARFLEILRGIDENDCVNWDQLLEICVYQNFPIALCEVIERKKNQGDCLVFSNATLKLAIEHGHFEVLKELLKWETRIDNDLILFATKPFGSEINQRSRLKCLKLVLQQPDINVRCEDENGNSPLYYAAKAGDYEAVQLLIKAGCYICHPNIDGVLPIAHIPASELSQYLDSCLQGGDDETDKGEIEFDYRFLIPHSCRYTKFQDMRDSLDEDEVEQNILSLNLCRDKCSLETDPLIYIAENESLKHLLKHPILASFLTLKWQRIKYIHTINLIFFAIFHVFINLFLLSMTYSTITHHEKSKLNDSTSHESEKHLDFIHHSSDVLWYITTTLTIFLLVRDIFQLSSSPCRCYKSFENWLDLFLIGFSSAVLYGANLHFGAVVCLLSVWRLMIEMGYDPKMSTRIHVFKVVIQKFFYFITPYAVLIFTFTISFFVLFSNDENFSDLEHSLSKTFLMTAGEINLSEILLFSSPFHGIFIIFVFLIVMVLFNILIGLAVCDTVEIFGNAELVGLIIRTQLISYYENIAINGMAFRKCFFINYFHKLLYNRIFLFPRYLPRGKIGVIPLKRNAIRIYGKEDDRKKKFMGEKIVVDAKKILLKRNNFDEREEIVKQLTSIINQQMDQLKTIVKQAISPEKASQEDNSSSSSSSSSASSPKIIEKNVFYEEIIDFTKP